MEHYFNLKIVNKSQQIRNNGAIQYNDNIIALQQIKFSTICFHMKLVLFQLIWSISIFVRDPCLKI